MCGLHRLPAVKEQNQTENVKPWTTVAYVTSCLAEELMTLLDAILGHLHGVIIAAWRKENNQWLQQCSMGSRLI